MIIRKINSLGDWQFGKGLASYATEEMAIEENIKTRILSWVGDCFFAPDEGVDWRNRLDTGQLVALRNEIRALILKSFGVVGVSKLEFVFEGESRNYTITYEIETIYSRSFQRSITSLLGV